MPRKGRFLEILVKHLQGFLGPRGLEIMSPELFYENGKLIGEIDVTIRGKLGSSSIFVGIECRDRPQDSPQGVPWLTQIYGKQNLFKAHKMIAVSTTGFTPEAVKVAQGLGIDLLTITDANEIDLSDWFYTIDFVWQDEFYEITGAIDIATEPKTLKGMRSFRADIPFLKLGGISHPVTLDEFMKRDLDNLFSQLPNVDSGVVQAEAFIQGTGQLDAELEGEQFKITKLVVPVKLSKEVVRGGLLLNACRDLHQGEIIAVTGTAMIETGRHRFKVLAIAKKSASDENLRDLQINFLTENNEPYLIPAGTRISLFGKE